MTTTTRSLTKLTSKRGMTLVELMVSSTIAAFVLLGVLTMFLFMGRGTANLANYNDLENQARNCLEQFAQDTRQASAITWNSAKSITLVVDSTAVTYTYNSTAQTFSRTASGSTKTLITGVYSFQFTGYRINGTSLTYGSSDADGTTKQIQLSLRASRTSQTVTTATNTVLSARFILRNKIVTA